MKIAVTGFLPFNGRDINPSQLIAEQVRPPKGTEITVKILSVEYKSSSAELLDFLEQEKPDALLSIGQAGNAPYIAVERVAVNLDNSRTADSRSLFPDQAGYAPVDEPIDEKGPAAYFSTLPVWDIVTAVNDKNIPARASYSAGTFICNHVMYEGLKYAAHHGNMRSGFIHVPFLPEQLGENPRPGCYSMELSDMVRAVQTALEVIAET